MNLVFISDLARMAEGDDTVKTVLTAMDTVSCLRMCICTVPLKG